MSENLENFKLAIVPQDFLSKMEAEIAELKSILKGKSEDERDSEWIESVKIPKILGVSRKTYQEWRNKRLLSFSQIGNKIYVRRSDLDQFMKDHYIEAKQ